MAHLLSLRNLRSTLLLWSAFLTITFTAAADVNAPSPKELLNNGRVDEAVTVLQKRVSNAKDDAESFNLLARAYYSLESWDPAIKAAETAVSLAPNNSEYRLWLARAFGKKAEQASIFTAPGLAKRSREQFEKAVELDGANIAARSDLAEFYLEAPGIIGGGKDKARAQAETAAKKDPSIPHWVNARLAEKDKNYAEAEKEYKAAIQASDNDPVRLLNLASFYRRQQRYPEMENAINNAVGKQRKPNNIFVDAASLLLRAGRSLPQAAQLVGKYLAGNSKNEDAPAFHAHYVLGQILEKQGDKSGALREYKAALDLARNYGPAKDALSRLQKNK
jgi:tetratricopeptide (TPR) repeat protein